MGFDISGYNDVASRLVEFRAKHPEGSLQPYDLAQPFRVVTVDNKTFIAYVAAAYRTPDDERPGIGMAWEPFPGKTPYTKDSELQNAETAAWGRAIMAAGAADARKGISTEDEVRNRRADQEQESTLPVRNGPARMAPDGSVKFVNEIHARIGRAVSVDAIAAIGLDVTAAVNEGRINDSQYQWLSRTASKRRTELQLPEEPTMEIEGKA